MTGAELIAEVRLRLRDQAAPYLWTDAAILTYVNEAQREFCVRTHALLDFDCHTIQTAAGINRYEMDADVLAVKLAKITTDTYPLRAYTNPMSVTFNSTQSKPSHFGTMGGSPMYLSLSPTPDAVYTVQLAVAVLPTALVLLGTEPEIAQEDHMSLASGAIVECLKHSDTDGFNAELLDVYEARWAIILRNAKREAYRRALGPNPMATIPSWTGGS